MSRTLTQAPASQRQLPDWLKKSLASGAEATRTDALIKQLGLNTICESGRCPNRNECYSQKTATFMIMGDVCTRSCAFCSVSIGRPAALDADEPARIAQAVQTLGLAHVVITSVNRDDLADEGAAHFAQTIRSVRTLVNAPIVEILTPDFKRTQASAVACLLAEKPQVFNHNVETVPSLYKKIRPQAFYETSLRIFSEIRSQDPGVLTKSGLMLGLGETQDELLQVLRDLHSSGCQMLTLGQYLKSSNTGAPVAKFYTPSEFEALKQAAYDIGFLWVESAPYVRSSFHAKDSLVALKKMLLTRGHILNE